MEDLKHIRFRQRFNNFEKAFSLLSQFIKIENPTQIERAGGIQFFEMCFELAWNLLKDYLETEGFFVNSPRGAIKQAVQSGIIDNGHIWIDALDDRNLTVHTYDDKIAEAVVYKIKVNYFPVLENLYISFKDK